MTPEESEGLLDDVRAGLRPLTSLTGQQVQEVLFHRLVRILLRPGLVQNAVNHRRGPVDYVLEEITPDASLSAPSRFKHYFEVKHYARTLELDHIAKFMIIGVVDQPASLNVVSRTQLQPQVLDYARTIFYVDGQQRPLLSSVRFSHWETAAVIGRDDLFAPRAGHGTTARSPREPQPTQTLAWVLSLCTPFAEPFLASNSDLRDTLRLEADRTYRLRVDLPGSAGASNCRLSGLPSAAWRRIESPSTPSSDRTVVFLLDTGRLEPNHRYDWRLLSRTQDSDSAQALPTIETALSGSYLPELRNDQVRRLVRILGARGVARLVIVEGEAGVGKTHLSERVAEGLRIERGVDTVRVTVAPERTTSFSEEVLTALLTPTFARDALDESFRVVAEHLARRLTEDSDPAVSMRIASGAAVRGLLYALARLGPRLLIIRDCHRLSDADAQELWTFIGALDDLAWGDFRLVLECRQPEAAQNAACTTLLSRIRERVKLVRSVQVLALGRAEIAVVLRPLLSELSPELTEAFYRSTAGLPLFLGRYLEALEEHGVIRRRPDGKSPRWVVEQTVLLTAGISDATGLEVLEERIRALFRDTVPASFDPTVASLGLLALAGSPEATKFVRTTLTAEGVDWEPLLERVAEKRIAATVSSGELVFVHDLLRQAAINVARRSSDFNRLGRLLLQRGSRDDANTVLFLASVAQTIDDDTELIALLQLGVELAINASDYRRQVEMLVRLDGALARAPMEIVGPQRLRVLNQLAWAEWTHGSTEAARTRYANLIEVAEQQLADQGQFSLAQAVSIDARRRCVGLDLELMDLPSFISMAMGVIGGPFHPVPLASVLNRLVLYCGRLDYARIGLQFAELSLRVIDDGRVDNQGAVICSDAGLLFQLAEPAVAHQLYLAGIYLAQDERQRTHNRTDLLFTTAIVDRTWSGSVDLSDVWDISVQKGFTGIWTRLLLFRGAQHIRAGDVGTATEFFERARTTAALHRLRWLELYATHDLAMCHLLAGNLIRGRRYLTAVVETMSALAAGRRLAMAGIERALATCTDLLAGHPEPRLVIPLPKSVPDHCGPFFAIGLNLACVHEAYPEVALEWPDLNSAFELGGTVSRQTTRSLMGFHVELPRAEVVLASH